jgi:hypothetical protein
MRPACLSLLAAFVLPAASCRSTKPNAAPGPSAFAPPGGLVFTGRRPDGREIALSNRTKWAIRAAGSSATLHWQPGEPVQLGSSGEPLWPAAITSLTTGATAFARPAGGF